MRLLGHLPAWLDNYDIQRFVIPSGKKLKSLQLFKKNEMQFKSLKMEKGKNQN